MRIWQSVMFCAVLLAARVTAEAQQWTSIVPGKTSVDELVAMIGKAELVEPAANGSMVAVYRQVGDAVLLRIGISSERTVEAYSVEPGNQMTEADVMALFGTARKVLGISGSGLRLVSYPIGGAQAEYDGNGRVVRLSVSGGVATEGLNAKGLLRSWLSGRKPGTGGTR